MSEATRNVFRQLLKGGGLAFVGRVLELGIAFVGAALVARWIGPLDFGAVTLGSAILSTVSSLAMVGLHVGVVRYLPRYNDEQRRRGVLVSAFQITIPIAVVAGLAVVFGADYLSRVAFDNPSLAPVLRIFGLAIPFAVLVEMTVASTQGAKLVAPKVVIQNLTIPTVRVTLAAAVLLLGYSAVGVSFAYAFAHVVAGTLGIYYLIRRTPLLTDIDYVPMHRELMVFSAPLIVNVLMNKALGNLDTFLLGYFVGTADIGVYNVAYTLATLLIVIYTSTAFIFMPIISDLHSESRSAEMRRVYQIVTKWVFMATLPMFLVIALFPKLTISVTFGSQYTQGATTLSVLALGFFVYTFVGPNSDALMSIGETKLLMYDNVLVAVVNGLLNVYLIPRYSIVGAAVATTAAYTLGNFLFSVQLYRRTGIQPFSLALVRPGVVSLVLVFAFRWVIRTFFEVTLPVLVVGFVFFILAYGVVILRFGGIEEEEIQLIFDFEDKFDVDLGPLKNLAARLT